MTNAIGKLLLVFVLGLVHLACPFNHSTRHTRRFSCYRCVKGGEDNISQRGLKFSSVEPKNEESHQEQCTPWSSPLADCHQYANEWSGLCEDVDKVMERLVSPAPESFHVLHSVISKINSKTFSGNTSTNLLLNDLIALAAFLVKPDHSIELYPVDEVVKWRLVPCQTSKSGVIHPEYLQKGEDELYHMHNALQLSRMASDIATKAPNDPQIHEISRQAERRLSMTMGSDLRGVQSSEACFNFALAGIQHFASLFQALAYIGIHELTRAGPRASFKPLNILQMVEKFGASDIQGEHALELYSIAGDCLQKKGYNDPMLVQSLKEGTFGFHCDRPLIWLWRFSSRQKKVPLSEFTSKSSSKRNIEWSEVFADSSKPLVVDVGSGMGTSLLNLSMLANNAGGSVGDDSLQLAWSDFNYAGTDLNQNLVNFGNGIVSRDNTRRGGRVHFFCLSAEDFLTELQSYPGGLALIMINFPSPFRLEAVGAGNSQLPSKHSNQFLVTGRVLTLVAKLLSSNAKPDGDDGLFLFQTKCEDIAVHVKNECIGLGKLECIPSNYPVSDIDQQYKISGKRPKRVDEWLKSMPTAERAEGSIFSSNPILPREGRPETEVQCSYDNTVVHRCLFRGMRCA